MTVTVLLTTAVRPSAAGRLTVVDPAERLSQYATAIRHWVSAAANHNWKLAIVETTGAAQELSKYCKLPATVWLEQYDPREQALVRGKGAVEANALDWAIDQLRQQRAPSTSIFKCTGRLYLRNSHLVVSDLGDASLRLRSSMDGSWVDSRFFGVQLDVWDSHFRKMGDEIDDRETLYLERILARRVHLVLGHDLGAVERFAHRPQLVGVSGSTGRRYGGRMAVMRGALLDPIESLLSRSLARKQM